MSEFITDLPYFDLDDPALEPLRDVGDPKQVRAEKKKAERRQRLLDNVVYALMEHCDTRIWLWDVLQLCNVYSSSFSHNALTTAFAEGKRAVGLKLLADIMRVAPENYATMARDFEGV